MSYDDSARLTRARCTGEFYQLVEVLSTMDVTLGELGGQGDHSLGDSCLINCPHRVVDLEEGLLHWWCCLIFGFDLKQDNRPSRDINLWKFDGSRDTP